MAEDKCNNIEFDPEIEKALNKSTYISSKSKLIPFDSLIVYLSINSINLDSKGRGAMLLVQGSKRRRTKHEMDEAKLEAE